MRHSYRPDIPPQPQPYRTQVCDPVGLVAGMFEALGITEGIDQATQQDPERRMVTAGQAVTAMVRTGLGLLQHQLDLVPHLFQHKPLARLIAPGMHASPLNDATLGRTLDTLDEAGVTTLYSLIAATAAQRLGQTPTATPLERTSCHVDGRSKSHEEPEEHVMHIPRGYSRDRRPDLHHVMLDLMGEHRAGMPVLLQPLRGKRSDAQAFGQLMTDHRALERAENLHKLAETRIKWMTRVPAT